MDSIIIGVVGTVFVSAISCYLTYRFTRKRQLEAEWRTDKLNRYIELLRAMAEVVGRGLKEEKPLQWRRFSVAAAALYLVAPQSVTNILAELDDVLELGETDPTDPKVVESDVIERLVLAMRKDVGIGRGDDPEGFRFTILPLEGVIEKKRDV